MTQEQFSKKLIKQFPEKKAALIEHYQNYGELLGHVFFAEEINIPLIELLTTNTDIEKILAYCAFIEDMWFCGNDITKNIVEVTILERLTDDIVIWKRFGRFISKRFKQAINNEIIPHFREWLDVSVLRE
nr:hypothetical protein [uncultured Anaerostipes sp.]